MTNHVHLAVRTGAEPLSRIIAGLHSSYAEWFNRRHDRVGHLFQGRYKAYLVQEERYLQALLRYIHRNPVEAGIVKRAADYPWSSDRYLRSGRGPEWLDVDRLFSLLGMRRSAASRQYAELVDGVREDHPYPLEEVVDQVVMGDQVFAASRFEDRFHRDKPLRGIGVDRLLGVVARELGLSLDELASTARSARVSEARCVAAYLARRFARISVRRVANRLNRDDSSFVRPLARLESRIRGDADLRATVDRIVRALRQLGPEDAPARSGNQD